MKKWLNDLQEGDIFYFASINGVYKCVHCGIEITTVTRVPQVKYKIIFGSALNDITFLMLSNTWVYDNFAEARDESIRLVKERLDKVNEKIEDLYTYKNDYESKLKEILETTDK